MAVAKTDDRCRFLFAGRQFQAQDRITIAPRAVGAKNRLAAFACTSCGQSIRIDTRPGRRGSTFWSGGGVACSQCCPHI
jgi:hypothetical protein